MARTYDEHCEVLYPSEERREDEDVITADTITDEQIRELRVALESEGARGEYAYCVPSPHALTQIALGRSELRRVARARCAEILNARRKEQR